MSSSNTWGSCHGHSARVTSVGSSAVMVCVVMGAVFSSVSQALLGGGCGVL
jgi:hypothetical protein